MEKQTRKLADNNTGTIGNMRNAISLEKPEIVKPQVSQATLIPFQTLTFQYDNQGKKCIVMVGTALDHLKYIRSLVELK